MLFPPDRATAMKLVPAQFSCLFLGLVLLGCSPTGKDSSPSETTPVTLEPLKTANWEAVLAAHKGKVVVVDNWATWCLPCVEGFPQLVELHRSLVSKGSISFP
jgi:thiol-disulfide isomerase/thioredoxin